MTTPARRTDPDEIMSRVAERVLTFRRSMMQKLDQRFKLPLGTKPASQRMVRTLTRMAAEGDEMAMQALRRLGVATGHTEGEAVPCSLCETINDMIGPAGTPEA